MPAEEPLKPPIKHKKPANKNPQQAAIPNPGVSAIGQLSSGDPADFRRETEDLINATERGLKSLNRSLNDQEQKTAAAGAAKGGRGVGGRGQHASNLVR